VPVRVSLSTNDGEVDERVLGWLASEDLRTAEVDFEGADRTDNGRPPTILGELRIGRGRIC
jgi:hypothetical protein